MADPLSRIMAPQTFQELFSQWALFPDAALCAGGTGFMYGQGSRVPEFPQSIILLDKIEELKKISRTERYLEIGAAVKLSQLIRIGKIVPEALSMSLSLAADVQVRNQASIAGNICLASPGRIPDAVVPMIALDAQYELRTAQSSRWISASRFSSAAPQELLTRIRIPLEVWSFTHYQKFGSSAIGIAGSGGSALFMMKNEKNILANLRIVCAGKSIFRDKSSEAMLLGKRLPLLPKDSEAFADRWKNYLSGTDSSADGLGEDAQGELAKVQIINFVRTVLRHISD